MTTKRALEDSAGRIAPDPCCRIRATHSELACAMARRFRHRIPPSRTVRLYVTAMALHGDEGRWLRRCVLREVPDLDDIGLLRFHRWMKVYSAPWGDPVLAAELEGEFARCRRTVGLVESRTAARPGDGPAHRAGRAALFAPALRRSRVPVRRAAAIATSG